MLHLKASTGFDAMRSNGCCFARASTPCSIGACSLVLYVLRKGETHLGAAFLHELHEGYDATFCQKYRLPVSRLCHKGCQHLTSLHNRSLTGRGTAGARLPHRAHAHIAHQTPHLPHERRKSALVKITSPLYLRAVKPSRINCRLSSLGRSAKQWAGLSTVCC